MEAKSFETDFSRIEPAALDAEYHHLQTKFRQGSGHILDQLTTYRHFFQTLDSFLNQPSASQSEKKDVIRRYFYQPQHLTDTPIGFFLDMREGLIKRNWVEDRLGQADIWQEVEGSIKESVKGELERSTYNINQEAINQRKVLELAKKAEEGGAEDEALALEIRAIQAKKVDIKNRASTVIEEDSQFREDLEERDQLASSLDWLINAHPNAYDSQTIEQTLGPFQNHPVFRKPDGRSWMEEIKIRKDNGQTDRIQTILTNLQREVKSPQFVWQTLSQKGVIPPQLTDSFEMIAALYELQQVTTSLAGMPKEVKAKYLAPYLGRNINAAALLEIIEGRTDEFMDNLLDAQIDAFLHFYDGFMEEHKKLGGKELSYKQKAALVAITAMVAAAPFIFKGLTGYEEAISSEQAKVEQILDDLKVGKSHQQEEEEFSEAELEQIKKNFLLFAIPEKMDEIGEEKLREIIANYPDINDNDLFSAKFRFDVYAYQYRQFELNKFAYTTSLRRTLEKNYFEHLPSISPEKQKELKKYLNNLAMYSNEGVRSSLIMEHNVSPQEADGMVALVENYRKMRKNFNDVSEPKLADLIEVLKKYPVPYELLPEDLKKKLAEGRADDHPLRRSSKAPLVVVGPIRQPQEWEETKKRSTPIPDSSVEFTKRSTGRVKPQNSSVEDYKRSKGVVMWQLEREGFEQLNGYYRTSTASQFFLNTGWLTRKETESRSRMPLARNRDLTVRSTERLSGEYIDLPSRDGYAVTADSWKVSGASSPAVLVMAQDGTYVLKFNKQDLGKQVTIEVSFGKINRSSIPDPKAMAFEESEMRRNLITRESLTEEFQQLFKELDKKNLSRLEQARVLEQYVRDTFQYSLNPAWSDYYNDARTAKEYFRRIAEIKKADCDVANTFLLMLLRARGIPSRMAFGFSNQDRYGGIEQLTANEGHGWVEIFLEELPEGQRWVTIDGTPTSPDEYTRDHLERDFSLGLGLPDIESFLAFLQILKGSFNPEQLARGLLYEGELWRLLPDVMTYLLYNSAIFTATRAIRRRNDKGVERLTAKLNERADRYLGESHLNLRSAFGDHVQRRVNSLGNEGSSWGEIINPLLTAVLAKEGVKNWISHGLLGYFPFVHRTDKVEESVQPDRLEFFTRALGFPEAEVRNGMQLRSIRLMRHQVYDDLFNLSKQFFQKYHCASRSAGRFGEYLRKKLSKLDKPKDIKGWEDIKSDFKDQAHDHYLESWDKEEEARGFSEEEESHHDEDEALPERLFNLRERRAKWRERTRKKYRQKNTEAVYGKQVDEEEFGRLMEDCLASQVMLWQLDHQWEELEKNTPHLQKLRENLRWKFFSMVT